MSVLDARWKNATSLFLKPEKYLSQHNSIRINVG